MIGRNYPSLYPKPDKHSCNRVTINYMNDDLNQTNCVFFFFFLFDKNCVCLIIKFYVVNYFFFFQKYFILILFLFLFFKSLHVAASQVCLLYSLLNIFYLSKNLSFPPHFFNHINRFFFKKDTIIFIELYNVAQVDMS